MRIGLNATCFNNRPSGARQRFVGIYGELIKRLCHSEFIIFEPAETDLGNWFVEAPNVCIKKTPVPADGRVRKALTGLRYWPATFRREKLNIFEQFNLPLVKSATGQTLLTIHDMRGLHPHENVQRKAAFRAVVGRSLREADHVVTVSETMKEEILGAFPGTSVSVIYNGLDISLFDRTPNWELSNFRQNFALPNEFVLAVGHLEKRKNIPRLVDAIARLRDQGEAPFLLVIGNDSGERKAIEQRVKLLNLTSHVKILSGLSDEEVRCAYKLSSLVVFPSAYEGFGIPIIEAMAAGRPIVMSDIAVFREITEGQGVYFDHQDTESMANAIRHGLDSSSERSRLVEYGKRRVQDFSFQSLAAKMESLYSTLGQ